MSSPSSRRFSVTKATPLRDALARRVAGVAVVADDDLAGVVPIETEEDARELGAPGAHQAEEAEHLAACRAKVDVLDDAVRAERLVRSGARVDCGADWRGG